MVGAELQGGLKHKKAKKDKLYRVVYLILEISKNSTLLFLYIIKVIIIKTIKK